MSEKAEFHEGFTKRAPPGCLTATKKATVAALVATGVVLTVWIRVLRVLADHWRQHQ